MLRSEPFLSVLAAGIASLVNASSITYFYQLIQVAYQHQADHITKDSQREASKCFPFIQLLSRAYLNTIQLSQLGYMEGNQILLKLISVGDTKTGKSCIIKRYCQGRFVQKYITTIGVDYGVKKVTVSGRKVAVNFFDLSGSSDYEEIRNPFFEDAQVILLIFDLENRESFNNLGKWQSIMKNYGVNAKDSVIMLVGNKCDGRTKEVDPAEAIAYAKKKGYEYFQVSASTGENINEVFQKAFNKAVSAMQDKRKVLQ